MDAIKNLSAPTRKPRTKKKNYKSFKSFIYKVLKQVAPATGISTKGMDIMDAMVEDLYEKLAVEAGRLARYNKKATITSREIQTAVRLSFPGEIAKHAVSEGTKAVTKFNVSMSDDNEHGKRAARAGLQFPVGRIHSRLKKGGHADRISQTAPVYLAAVLEYVVAEVLELSSGVAKDLRKKRIVPRHILLSTKTDTELAELFAHAQISRGGVVPHVHYAILSEKQKKKLPVSAQEAY